MIVKEIISEELLTLPEVKELLEKVKEDRKEEETELGYELRKVMAHAETFSRVDSEKSRELINELMQLEKMKPEIANRIADILPLSNDEIRSIYAKERYSLTEEELNQIIEIVLKFA